MPVRAAEIGQRRAGHGGEQHEGNCQSRPKGQIPTLQQRHQWPEQCRCNRGADASEHHRVDVEIHAEGRGRAISGADVLEEAEKRGIPIGPEGDDREEREQRQHGGHVPRDQAQPQNPRRGVLVAGGGRGVRLLGRSHGGSMLPDARRFCDRTPSAPGSGEPALPSFSMTSAAAGTLGLTPEQISAIDAAHLWHPYSTIGAEAVPPVVAVGARGAWLTLVRDGKQVQALDAMSSWWTAIHGHGHPVLDAAMTSQLATMNHVMFGGLTHEPAARLAQLLVEITPHGLDTVFFSDSGSVSVEVAVKMALQYWRGRGLPGKRRLMTGRGGYHGDTFTRVSRCNPGGGRHSAGSDLVAGHVFAPQEPGDHGPAYGAAFEAQLAGHAAELAAVVV